MTLTDEQLKLLQEYAGLFFTYSEIAVLLDVDPKQFTSAVKNKTTKIHHAYQRGKMLQKLELRRKVVSMAIKGSPQAEILVHRFITDQQIGETD